MLKPGDHMIDLYLHPEKRTRGRSGELLEMGMLTEKHLHKVFFFILFRFLRSARGRYSDRAVKIGLPVGSAIHEHGDPCIGLEIGVFVC